MQSEQIKVSLDLDPLLVAVQKLIDSLKSSRSDIDAAVVSLERFNELVRATAPTQPAN